MTEMLSYLRKDWRGVMIATLVVSAYVSSVFAVGYAIGRASAGW